MNRSSMNEPDSSTPGSIIELPPLYSRAMLGKDYEAQDCSIARALGVVGERWTLLIVRDAFNGVRRFNDFQAHLDIPRAVLSNRLTGLVDDGVLERRPDPDRAGTHIYELTDAGRDLWPALYALLVWGDRHRYPNSRVYKHATCGTALDEGGRCAKCGRTPGPEEILTEPRRGRGKVRSDPVAVALRRAHRLLEPLDV
jgi:DNA-binding HxlR family transcriptional regulator